jgi:hypothetical protein
VSLKAEVFALLFGVLLILVTFGDNHFGIIAGVQIGNLDTIFGYDFWPILDMIYPLTTIITFLLYGRSKGGKLRIDASSGLVFATFIVLLSLMNFDDIAIVLRVAIYPARIYWTAISVIYPIFSAIALFLFGKLQEKNHLPKENGQS